MLWSRVHKINYTLSTTLPDLYETHFYHNIETLKENSCLILYLHSQFCCENPHSQTLKNLRNLDWISWFVEDEIYWRGINESDPPTDAIGYQTSGHSKYNKVPNEKYKIFLLISHKLMWVKRFG